jgi:glutamate-ammonia-ligase adenylyltransferase
MFRIGVRILSDTVSAEEAGIAFSDLADVMIDRLLSAVQGELALRHGHVSGERIAVVAMGKLGGREMTAGSDLDLILIYDAAKDAELSAGPRPLSVMQYFGRITQRLIAALSSPTPEGILYEVDLRLRPSGNKGPVASHLDSFVEYQRTSAWTWEKLALTRARVVAGDADFGASLGREIAQVLSRPCDEADVRADVLDMRRRMLREIGSRGLWDVKQARGGLVEVEFIAQFLQIAHAAGHPAILRQNTMAALASLAEARLLSAGDAQRLEQAARLYHRLTHLLRLCVAGAFDPGTAVPGLRQLLFVAAGTPDLERTEALLADTQSDVARIFDRLIGKP